MKNREEKSYILVAITSNKVLKQAGFTNNFAFHSIEIAFYLLRGCLGVWLWLLFKVLFIQKNMSIIFFYFLKIIFKISTSK